VESRGSPAVKAEMSCGDGRVKSSIAERGTFRERRLKSSCLAAAAAALAIVVAGAPHNLTSLLASTIQTPTSTVVFFDDFAASTLDRDAWNVIVTGRTVNNEQQAYVDSQETIAFVTGEVAAGAENGALKITARARPGFKTPEGRAFDFISGRLDTRGKIAFTYGTVSARIKLTTGAGLWPAFWVLGDGRWPDTGEMDVMENVGAPDWTNSALHGPGYSGNTPLVARRSFPTGQDITGWHVYSMDWSSGGFVFKVDDDAYYRVTREAVERYGPWAYDTPKHLIVNLALGGQYPQGVNKITAPYPGLAADTVDLIKADKATMLVDWVRVTRQ
jgi:beta-glucanase (GH16 family)